MASTSDSGHPKNVANFEKVVTSMTALGTAYNPSKTSLKLTALTTLLTTAKAVTTAYNTASSNMITAQKARDAAFKILSPYITRINNGLKASDTTTQVDESVMSLVRKLQGRRATPKKTEEQKKAAEANGKEVIEISAVHMSFDNRIDNFDKFIKLLTTIPAYAPNEADLKLTAITAYLNDLKAKNAAAVSAETAFDNARIARNEVLYKPNTGLVDISVDIKSYIKSVFGATSPQYKQISKIEFKSMKI